MENPEGLRRLILINLAIVTIILVFIIARCIHNKNDKNTSSRTRNHVSQTTYDCKHTRTQSVATYKAS